MIELFMKTIFYKRMISKKTYSKREHSCNSNLDLFDNNAITLVVDFNINTVA